MTYLKQIGLALVDLLKQIVCLPQLVVDAVKQRKLRAIAERREAERLDRIRNPSKYLGK
jgi:hypothetical protein